MKKILAVIMTLVLAVGSIGFVRVSASSVSSTPSHLPAFAAFFDTGFRSLGKLSECLLRYSVHQQHTQRQIAQRQQN